MTSSTCPFLGLIDDPTTTLNFPSAGNYCHLVKPVASVNRNHQQSHCLSKEHTSCPVFTSGGKGALPEELLSPEYKPAILRKSLLVVGLVILFLIIGFGLSTLWVNFRSMSNPQFLPTGDTEQYLETNTTPNSSIQDMVLLSPTPSPTSLFSNNIPTDSNIPVTQCVYPEGWIVYVVKPTDSLFRLSVVYRISILDLQKANCLSEGSVIRAGQELYVPNPPTSTPTLISTPSETPTPPTPFRTQPVIIPRPSATDPPRSTPIPATVPATATSAPPPIPTTVPPATPTSPQVDTPTSPPPENTTQPPTSPPPTSPPPTSPPPTSPPPTSPPSTSPPPTQAPTEAP